MNDNFITVDAHEVNHGDLLAGVAHAGDRQIGSILWDASIQADGRTRGAWIYGDEDGRELDRRPLGARVQVIRGSRLALGDPVTHVERWAADPVDSTSGEDDAASLADPDDCAPHGITRGPGGLFVVTP